MRRARDCEIPGRCIHPELFDPRNNVVTTTYYLEVKTKFPPSGHLARAMTSTERHHDRRQFLRNVARQTLHIVKVGAFTVRGRMHRLHTNEAMRATRYYPTTHPALAHWHSPSIEIHPPSAPTSFSVHEISTLEGVVLLSNVMCNNPRQDAQGSFSRLANIIPGRGRSSTARPYNNKVGVLNFANATKPGGGFINGSQAQEESIARSSTLYPTLTTIESAAFYNFHRVTHNPYYTHAMIYSPGVEIFRDDDGGWMSPIAVDVLTSAAVNAKEVRQQTHGGRDRGPQAEYSIELVMRERMARMLCLFELQGVRNLVLGSFGTGVFQNDVGLVAQSWAELLAVPGARFQHSFDRVFFAIMGHPTIVEFNDVFCRTQARRAR